jgi:hypothetical protein
VRDMRLVEARARYWHKPTTPEQIEEARALGRAVAKGPPEPALLEEAKSSLDRNRSTCSQVFYDEFISAVRELPERRAAWTRALSESFSVARETIMTDLFGKSDKPQLDGASRDWEQEKDPFSVWGRQAPYVSYRNGTIWYATQLLIRVHPGTGLRALDTLPYPELMDEVLHLYFGDDRDLIEELIKVAPPLFDEHGAWRPERSVAALLVTDLVTTHAKKLHETLASTVPSRGVENLSSAAEDALKHVDERELQPWMERAFGLLLERPDGLRIAVGYLGYLSQGQLLGGDRPQEGESQWTAQSAAITALVATLNRASVSVARVREAWLAAEQIAVEKSNADANRNRVRGRSSSNRSEHEGEGPRSLHAKGLPFLLSAAALLGDAPPCEPELEVFWAWFEELLERRDPGLTLITYGNSLVKVPQRFGGLLSRLPFPDTRLRAAYEKLEPQRRRALFAYSYEGVHPDLESVVLLRIGLNTAASWLARVEKGTQADAARELFFWIYSAARRLWLTAVLDTGKTKQQLVTACFAFMPLLFGDTLGDALKKAIPAISSDARMLVEACANLQHNGVGAANLLAHITDTDADLIAALHDVHQWSELTGSKEDFPEHLQKLATELGIDFARPAVAPDSERTRRLREAFAEAIPWGRALLSRFEADGCSGLRAVPLDQPGNSWVLQITVPKALRDRFGLSPDLRILAVNGQVRGPDLRRAMEEPEGIAEVDPDLLLIASPSQGLRNKLSRLAGPWGQRVPWSLTDDHFMPLADCLQEHLPAFDLFARRDPVRGRAFIGRRREVDAIAGRLLRGQTVGVFGLRKVGKSSLLQAVAEVVDPVGAALGSRARVSSDAPVEALVVWLDVQSLVVRTRDAVAERLWEGLKERLDATGISTSTASSQGGPVAGGPIAVATLRDEGLSKDPLDNLRRLLVAVLARPEGLPVCFIVDEYDLLFEGYGGEPAVPGVEQIFALLRSVGQMNGRVSLALIGRDPVFIDQPHLNGFTNPLLGWVEPFHLGPFSDADTAELLLRLGRRVGLECDQATIQLALRWTGGHPLLLREYGSALHEAGRASRAALPIFSETLNERAVPLFLRRDAVHTICGEVEALLETRFPESLALLRAVAAAPDQDARDTLERHGGGGGKFAKVLFDFGLLRATSEAPWLPLVYRDYFGIDVPESRTFQRSQSHAG